jgi:hypothetical protein
MMLHYTDKKAYNAISSQVDWTFKASQPKGGREFGAYFTTMRVDANRFYERTRIPVEKREYVFMFHRTDGLRPYRGGRGEVVFLSPVDYVVVKERQIDCGETPRVLGLVKENE